MAAVPARAAQAVRQLRGTFEDAVRPVWIAGRRRELYYENQAAARVRRRWSNSSRPKRVLVVPDKSGKNLSRPHRARCGPGSRAAQPSGLGWLDHLPDLPTDADGHSETFLLLPGYRCALHLSTVLDHRQRPIAWLVTG